MTHCVNGNRTELASVTHIIGTSNDDTLTLDLIGLPSQSNITLIYDGGAQTMVNGGDQIRL
jgi:hypothetical protein